MVGVRGVRRVEMQETMRPGALAAPGLRRLRRRVFLAAAFSAALWAHACTIEIEAVPESGFVAAILSAEGPAQLQPGQHYRLRIRERSGTYPIDETVRVLPN